MSTIIFRIISTSIIELTRVLGGPIPALGIKIKREERNLVTFEDIPINNYASTESTRRDLSIDTRN